MNGEFITKRQSLMQTRAELLGERSTFEPSWRECGDLILPHRPRWQVSDANRGERKNQSIIDGTATYANRTLGAGMVSGITSPARPWYRLTTPDPDLAEYGAVKEWLHDVTTQMRAVHLRSNLYNALPVCYEDLGAFGTAPIYVDEDMHDVLRCYSFPIGSYAIGKDHRGIVNVFVRDFRMTVRQLIRKFGKKTPDGKPDWSVFSQKVKDLWDRAQYETWIDVCHIAQPNENYRQGSPFATEKLFYECYWETGGSGAGQGMGYISPGVDDDRYLMETGRDYFPLLAPRWKVTGEDVYATSWPGLDALGDIKQLQLGEKRGMQAIEKMVNPPMVGPSLLRQTGADVLPGGITWVDEAGSQKGFRPAYEVTPRIQELEMKQQACRVRINRAFYADLFLMMANAEDRQRTAREIEERHEEKLLALGPVLEQLNQDLLDPLIDITFSLMLQAHRGLIPPPPQELHGMDLKVEYISMMAQAQKLVGISGMERLSMFVNNMAAETKDATVLDKVNRDQLIDDYAEAVGVSPKIIRTEDEVSEIRASRKQAQDQMAGVQMAKEGASAVKDLSQAAQDGGGLSELMRTAQAGNPLPAVPGGQV